MPGTRAGHDSVEKLRMPPDILPSAKLIDRTLAIEIAYTYTIERAGMRVQFVRTIWTEREV